MKKYLFLCFLFTVLLLTLAFKFPTSNTFPLFGRLIILDPGHGSLDPGSVYKDVYEKDYNLDFATTLKNELEKLGATVLMTRSGDYDLSNPSSSSRKRTDFNNRIKLINDNNPDLYLSLHMNSLSNTNYYGGQVFYSKVNDQNEIIAKELQDNLNNFFKLDRDYKKIGNDKYMFNKIKVRGILIEYGFITNYKDRKNLKEQTYRENLSKIISQSLINYFT